jgi:hypothetical protein
MLIALPAPFLFALPAGPLLFTIPYPAISGSLFHLDD